jgi:hypothetical protein
MLYGRHGLPPTQLQLGIWMEGRFGPIYHASLIKLFGPVIVYEMHYCLDW